MKLFFLSWILFSFNNLRNVCLFRSIDIGRRKSSTASNLENRRKSSVQMSTNSDDSRSNSLKSSNISEQLNTKFEAVREKYSPVKSKLKTMAHFIENNRQHIFYLVLFYGICLGLFTERFYCEYNEWVIVVQRQLSNFFWYIMARTS